MKFEFDSYQEMVKCFQEIVTSFGLMIELKPMPTDAKVESTKEEETDAV